MVPPKLLICTVMPFPLTAHAGTTALETPAADEQVCVACSRRETDLLGQTDTH
jgi:hypothetical protein